MRSTCGRMGAAAVWVALIAGMPAWGDETKLPLNELPQPVVAAVKARFKGAELLTAAQETENDQLRYEVTIRLKGQKIDVTLTPQGSLIEIEKQLAAKDLPKAVTKALEGKYPKATYKIAEEIFKVEKKKETLAYYEVLLVTVDQQTIEVQVAADGRIVHEEKKGAPDETGG